MSGGGNIKNKFLDDRFTIQDDGDKTKQLTFEIQAISTNTTRTITMPDADVDLSSSGGTFQPANSNLTDIAALTPTAANIIVGDGNNWITESGATARASLGLTIGTNVQAWNSNLDTISSLTPTDSYFIVGNGSAWSTESGATVRASLGLGTISTQDSTNVSITGGTITGITDLTVSDGGTGVSATTAYAVLCGGVTSTSPIQSIASVGSANQVLTSNGVGQLPTFQDADVGLTWSEVTGTSQSASVNTGYICNNASLVTVTLPSTAAIGDIVAVAGKGAGLFKIAQNASQTIYFQDSNTTAGTGGSLTSQERYNSIELICITANNDWLVRSWTGTYNIV